MGMRKKHNNRNWESKVAKKSNTTELWRKMGAAKKANLSEMAVNGGAKYSIAAEMAVNGGAKYSKAAHLWGFLPNRFEIGVNCTPSPEKGKNRGLEYCTVGID